MPKSSPAKLAFQKVYNAKPANVDRREANNLARQRAIRAGDVKVGDHKDVAHKRALDNGGSNEPDNTFIQDRGKNRAWRKGEPGYKVPHSKP